MKYSPLAAALGNASFLGVGYLILGRRLFAGAAAAGSVGLLVVLAVAGPPAWPWRVVLLLWWVASVAHGWLLAGGKVAGFTLGEPVALGRRRRLGAMGFGAAVLALIAGVGVDARLIGAEAASAHEAGECANLGERFTPVHKMVDGSAAASLDAESEACALLLRALAAAESDPQGASAILSTYMDGEARWEGAADLRAELMLMAAADRFDAAAGEGLSAVEAAFELLTEVVETAPDREEEARELVDVFIAVHPETADACTVMSTMDWLAGNPASAAAFEAAAAVPQLAPAALLGCADSLLAERIWNRAGDAYSRLAADYPDHELADRAREGAELVEVRIRLDGWPETDLGFDLPAYCEDPVPYSGAPAYSGSGPHRMAVFAMSEAADLPESWLAADITEAALIVCTGDLAEADAGTHLHTCQYEGGHSVAVHARQFPMTVYALQTGEEVFSGDFEIGGECPSHIYPEAGGTSQATRTAIDEADVRAAFADLVEP